MESKELLTESTAPQKINQSKKSKIIKTVLIIAVIIAFISFMILFDYSYSNTGKEIFESLKNGG